VGPLIQAGLFTPLCRSPSAAPLKLDLVSVVEHVARVPSADHRRQPH